MGGGRGEGGKAVGALHLADKFRNKQITRSRWCPPMGLKEFKDVIVKLVAKW